MIRHFIANPNAGGGKPLTVVKDMIALSEAIGLEEGKDFFVHRPKYKEETFEIARQYSDLNHKINQSEDVVIYAIGGDGTIFNVVNGMVGSGTKLSPIKAGSGNDFRRSINKNTKYVNLGYVNGKYFLNVASIGLDVDVAMMANELKSQDIKYAYAKGIIKAISNYHSLNLRINDELKPTTMIAICNGRYYGSGIGIAPKADLNDDLFDIYHFDEIDSTSKVIMEFAKLFLKVHQNSRNVTYEKAEEIKIEASEPVYYNLDGEIFTNQYFHFKIAAEKIEIYPQEQDKLFQRTHKKVGY